MTKIIHSIFFHSSSRESPGLVFAPCSAQHSHTACLSRVLGLASLW
jgi:hypothetical protein